ncbi:MAG: hypothetical protein Q7Q71_12220 [Verrucomicrobiota bacterium JB023]|nr:hypothetical protein [Verrucomicrobiota bacterium JB023]
MKISTRFRILHNGQSARLTGGSSKRGGRPGFSLIVVVTMMVLLSMVAIGLLSLSAVTLRSSSTSQSFQEARANARLALMVALGELQQQMGPDTRISMESALYDQNVETEEIDGVEQSRWLGVYDAWGNWLNDDYSPPEREGRALSIQDTYGQGRQNMFRRWLLSLPEELEEDPNAPLTASEDANWITLVGEGSLGEAAATNPDQVTRAYRNRVGETGRHAWWIGPENHRALVSLASTQRELTGDEWATSQGNTGEVGVAGLPGFEVLESQENLESRLVTAQTVALSGVDSKEVRRHFFDLTAHSKGVLTSVRTGQLKKDLSLLFEQENLPDFIRFNAGRDYQEPSIRPMSSDLTAKRPQIPNRHFQSWTNMRHFYRMYRQSSDATVAETGGGGSLRWSGSKPWTEWVSSTNLGKSTGWDGSNNYWRVPLLAKITFIYSLVSQPSTTVRGEYDCYHVYSPVFTFWNPYNVEMQIGDNVLQMLTSAYKVLPNSGQFWLGNELVQDSDDLGAFGAFGYSQGVNTKSTLRSNGGRSITFAPGEFKVFSHASDISSGSDSQSAELVPGFNPNAIGGEKKHYGSFSSRENPGLSVEFSHSYWGGNINWGNTGGSLCMQTWWDRSTNSGGIPLTYANDWFQKDQTHTPMTPPGLSNIARWQFADSEPVPVAFCQLVLKGLSEFNYESIDWAEDWRSRNWIHSPPFYFGNGMYISEDDKIAHTQRLDNPYVMYFGPTSMAEMPKVVAQVGTRSFAGSGSNPYEKVTSIVALELPTSPVSSLAGFSNMRINPGWMNPEVMGSHLSTKTYVGTGTTSTGEESLHAADTKRVAYQSGVTGPGIGNSFIHPMLPRTDIYRYIDNSKSEDVPDRSGQNWQNTKTNDTKAYNDYWDHVFLLNDALWDDYFVSSLADQVRPGASAGQSLQENLSRFVDGEEIANSRYKYYDGGRDSNEVESDLAAEDGYLKAAKHIVVDGMFNVNSTSVAAWYSLFAGIRERKLVVRGDDGRVSPLEVPSGQRIAISRFETELSAEEMTDPEYGVGMSDGFSGWSGVRFLNDDQLQRLAEECVKQVKLRGPFLNFSEFVNRRLSNDDLGLMGALQSAIDYDDDAPDAESINYPFKSNPEFLIEPNDLGDNEFSTPEAVKGSRFAGIPGYVIQSDLLRPIANTMSVRDDTFRIRGYGESLSRNGQVEAQAWCEAIVQRLPEYLDSENDPEVPFREVDESGTFTESGELTEVNRQFGRRFKIVSFRWLSENEV